MKHPTRLLAAFLVTAALVWSAPGDAQNCSNGQALYRKQVAGVFVGCAQSSCHGTNPASNNNNIQAGGASPANIENALATVPDMAGIGDPGGVYGANGLTATDIADIADWIFFAPTCPAPSPIVSANPNSLSFGSRNVATTSPGQTVTVSNTGAASATGMNYPAAPTHFARTTTGACGATLAVGASCTITFTFTPTAAGTFTPTYTITGGGISVPISLSGTGVSATPSLAASPGSAAFGSVAVGQTSSTQSITVTNSGGGAANGIAFSNPNAAEFLVTANTCGATLAAGASCGFSLAYRPAAAGADSVTLTINYTGGSTSVAMSGSGTAGAAANLVASPTTLAFGSVSVGATSLTQAVVVNNNGTAPATGIAFVNGNATEFLVSGNTCGATLTAGATCMLNVAYRPSAAGSDNATLTINSGNAGSPVVSLSGTGTSAGGGGTGQLSMPAAVTMPSQNVGTSGAAQAVSLGNIGTVAVTVASITSSASGEFTISANTCVTVAPGASCTFNLTFSPAIAGARSASVVIVSSGTGSPQTIAVSGTGLSAGTPPGNVAEAIEYYHKEFDHYFVTSITDEITKLDNGTFAGWTRTGKKFNVFKVTAAGLRAVCRFFSTAFGLKSSHFYTPDAPECTVLKSGTTWQFEDEVFWTTLPAFDGSCPLAAIPVYRLYNNGQGGAPNHRLLTDRAARDSMIADQGWIAEGYGPIGVMMCAPP